MASSLSLRSSAPATCALNGASRESDSASRLAQGALRPVKIPCSTTLTAANPCPSALRPVVAHAAADLKSSEANSQVATKYHFLVANAKFMLSEEEHFQEQLKERLRWLEEQGRGQDFWLVYEPSFLDSFPEISKRLNRPAVALVSTDGPWMTFMRIRLDRVLMGEFEADSPGDALEGKPIDVTFEKPENWIAPYSKYQADWWKPYVAQ